MVARHVQRLTTLLGLTTAQQTQATTIFINAATASQSLRTSVHTNRQSLSDAIKKNDTASIDTLSTALGTLTGQLTSIQAKADAAFYAILTADQQAKYDELGHGGMGPGMGPMGGPGGFGPEGRRPGRQ